MELEKGSVRLYNLETTLLGVFGAAMVVFFGVLNKPELTVVEETIVLVIFLGGLMGIAPIPFPNLSGRKFWYPMVAGLVSAFMDSFLVLLMVARIPLKGSNDAQMAFKALTMIAALIGGLLMYFGEVYALPHFLKYGMHHWYDGLPLIPPVIIFLLILGWKTAKLPLEVASKEIQLQHGEDIVVVDEKDIGWKSDWLNYLEFAAGIVLLLVTHNSILCLGILLLWAYISGQGMDLINVIKTETEVNVMLLLLIAWIIYEPVQPFLQSFTGFHAIWPSMFNAVISGALVPASGNFFVEVSAIAAGALFLPFSSLVGVMLFKDLKSWIFFAKISVPLMAVWLALSMSWFMLIWPMF